ncbi:MAG: cation transporter [Candidatus Paceibacterota bacterium]|jgi:cation diffusion facilitator family transporter
MVNKETRWFGFYPPYVFTALVLIQYLVKVYLKFDIGHNVVFSPVVEGDSYHNMSDVFECCMVFLALWFSKRPRDEEYPFGRKKAESLFQLTVGVALFCVACKTCFKVVVESLNCELLWGVKAWVEGFATLPKYEHLVVDPKFFWLVFGTMAISALSSFVMSTFQIKIGRAMRHPVMVADGKETFSDGCVESIASIGILCEHLFGMPWLEYPLGVAISCYMWKTAWCIFNEGLQKILQKSLGPKFRNKIIDLVTGVYGVQDVLEFKDFSDGSLVSVIMKLVTHCDLLAHGDIKLAIYNIVSKYMEEEQLGEFDYYIRFEPAEVCCTRVGYVMVAAGKTMIIAPSVFLGTHLRICDMRNDVIARWKDVPLLASAGVEPQRFLSQLAKLLTDKRTKVVYSFGLEEDTGVASNWVSDTLRAAGIEFRKAVSFVPEHLGFKVSHAQ